MGLEDAGKNSKDGGPSSWQQDRRRHPDPATPQRHQQPHHPKTAAGRVDRGNVQPLSAAQAPPPSQQPKEAMAAPHPRAPHPTGRLQVKKACPQQTPSNNHHRRKRQLQITMSVQRPDPAALVRYLVAMGTVGVMYVHLPHPSQHQQLHQVQQRRLSQAHRRQ